MIPWPILLTVLPVLYFVILVIRRQFKISDYSNRYVFITGCDSGFGNLLAERLDALGFHVIAGCLTEKGAQSLKKTCSCNIRVVSIDVTKETSIREAKQTVTNYLPRGKGLWAVVNNAGVAGEVAPFEWTSISDFNKVISVNLTGVVMITKIFLPLVRLEEGRIVNMASMCGRLAIATAAYNASKFAVEGFSDSIRRQLHGTGISVHIIEPGFFNTGIVNDGTIRAGLEQKYRAAEPEVQKYYGPQYRDAYIENSTHLLGVVMSPKIHRVVDAYEHAITAAYPNARYVVGWDANTIFRLLWSTPEWFSDFLITRLNPTPAGRGLHKKDS